MLTRKYLSLSLSLYLTTYKITAYASYLKFTFYQSNANDNEKFHFLFVLM